MSTGGGTQKYKNIIRVPKLYKVTAEVVKNVQEEGKSLKNSLYEQEKKHPNFKAIYALAYSTLQKSSELDLILRKTRILLDNQHLKPWLARVLIAELLWGKQRLSSGSTSTNTILSYEKQLREAANLSLNKNVESSVVEKVKIPRYVRVNTLKTTIDETIEQLQNEGYNLINVKNDYEAYLNVLKTLGKHSFVQDVNVPELFAFSNRTAFYDYDGYKNGKVLLQDKSSCLPAYLLNPPPGSVVLDMCAAPGMKTTHLASIMQNKGKIFAVEINEDRYKSLRKFVEETESICVETIHQDAMKLNSKQCPDVNYILVDPTCSGSGICNKISYGIESVPPERLTKLQSFQVMMLRHALLAFPNVKRVVYSTCSLNVEENEQVIDEILTNIGNSYKLVPCKELLNGQWKNFSSTDYNCKDNCLYARPSIDHTNGFFIAVFERNEKIELPQYVSKYSKLQMNYKRRKQQALHGNNYSNRNEGPQEEINGDVITYKRRRRRNLNTSFPQNENNKNDLSLYNNSNNVSKEEEEEVTEKNINKESSKKHKDKELQQTENENENNTNLMIEQKLNDDNYDCPVEVSTKVYNELNSGLKSENKKKKKKKKKNKDLEENKEECNVNGSVEETNKSVDESSIKTKKSKKRKAEDMPINNSEDNLNETVETNMLVDNSSIKAKKKKKKKNTEDLPPIKENEGNSEPTKKKKQKKNLAS